MFPFDDVIMFLWLSDVILRNRYWPTLAQIMARCLTAPSHHMNHCWLIMKAVLWNVAEDNFTKTVPDIIRFKTFEKLKFENTAISAILYFLCVQTAQRCQLTHIIAEYFFDDQLSYCLCRYYGHGNVAISACKQDSKHIYGSYQFQNFIDLITTTSLIEVFQWPL